MGPSHDQTTSSFENSPDRGPVSPPSVAGGLARVEREVAAAAPPPAVERRRAGRDLERARLRFQTEAGRVLASSLEADPMLEHVARLTVPLLGDWCLIDVVEEAKGGRAAAAASTPRRVAIAHADPARAGAAQALARIDREDEEGAAYGVSRAIRTGATELSAEITPADLRRRVRDPGRRAIVHAVGVHAQLSVPLVARGRTLGAITFLVAEPGRAYHPDEIAVAEDLGRRAALALENARLREAARGADAAKAEFLATMSHEFRTPLHVVLGYVDLLRMGVPVEMPPAAQGHLERIGTAATHLLHLVEQLLSFSRLDAQRETVQPTAVDATALAREVALLIEPLATAKGLRFEAPLPNGPVTLVTDVGKLRQILYNLLANAVKFTDRGAVSLGIREMGERVELNVRDTGIGIAPDDLAQIFDAFWRAEGRPTGDRGGTGLGLSISQRLARLLGGELSAVSTVGEGTTFTVTLPCVYEPLPT